MTATAEDAWSGIVPGLVSVTFRQLDVEAVVRLARECGLRAVEWGGDVHVPVGDLTAAERARELCAEHGLEIVSYGSYHRAGEHDPAEFEPVVRTAETLGAPSIRVWAGRLGSADVGPAERAAVVDGLRSAVEQAAARDVAVALEFHRNTLTDTVASTLALLDEVGPPLLTYWQPFPGVTPAQAQAEVDALLGGRLTTAHVFSWDADGARQPLEEGAALWQPVLERMRDDPTARLALLEFVADDSADQFRADAATLLSWL